MSVGAAGLQSPLTPIGATDCTASVNTGALLSCRLFLTPMIDAFNAAMPYIIGAGVFIVVCQWLQDKGIL